MHLPASHRVMACALVDEDSASGRRCDKVEMERVRWVVC